MVTLIAWVVAPVLHKYVAAASPLAVNSELPQLFCTEIPGAPGIVFGAAVAIADDGDVQPFTLCVAV